MLAVAAVTETLSAILQGAVGRTVPGAVVTTRPPDEVAAERPPAALNIFLYRASIDGGWLNADPDGVHPGESRRPALPLVLHYLLTPYASGEAHGSTAHRILGAAMSALYDHPELRSADLRSAAPFSNLQHQCEPVRVTLLGLGADDPSKLWTAFQSPYRLTAAYEARVVLIDSAVPGRAPLPVLRHGDGGRGPEAAASAVGRWPTLHAITEPVTTSGVGLILTGHRFDLGIPALRLTHPLHGSHLVHDLQPVSNTEVHATLPDGLGPGLWSATLVFTALDGTEHTTTTLPVRVAPRITGELPLSVRRDAMGMASLEVTCETPVCPEQRTELLVGEVPVAAEPFLQASRTLRFRLDGVQPGRHTLRLRVDGVDSPVLDTASEQPRFDPDTAVVVT
ncbi:DUF4255 domain-containing protein [Streptomyces sp. NPDC002265]|uniref:DUF4255 domain-containing protein n=1 Tax=Streptomyces sp. NPDC002265 TaxID=3154415 RepID=UPI0033187DA0